MTARCEVRQRSTRWYVRKSIILRREPGIKSSENTEEIQRDGNSSENGTVAAVPDHDICRMMDDLHNRHSRDTIDE